MVGVADLWRWADEGAGERARAGGVPKRGGEPPYVLDKAAARAETPGPADCEPAPSSRVPASASPPPSIGIGVRVPDGGCCGGTGEARRAMLSARGIEVPKERARNELGRKEPGRKEPPGEEERPGMLPGAGEFLPESLPEVDMIGQAVVEVVSVCDDDVMVVGQTSI